MDGRPAHSISVTYIWHVMLENKKSIKSFLARDVIYSSRVYATMSVSICLSVCL